MPDYSKIINDLRSKRGMTLQEIADKVGVDIKSIGNYQKGVEPRGKEVRAKLQELHATGDVTSMIVMEPATDYKVKVIELQDKMLEEKTATQSEAVIGDYKVKVNNKDAYLFNSLSALELKINVLYDLLLLQAGRGDEKRTDQLREAMSEGEKKGLKPILEKYQSLGLIDF